MAAPPRLDGPPPNGHALSIPTPLRYHWVRLRAACHPTEDPAKVSEAVRFVSGLQPEDFLAALRHTPIETHHGASMAVVEAVVEKSRAVRELLGRILAIPGARAELASSLEARTDEDGVFYLRVDKQEALRGGLVLTRGEDAIQLRLKMEHYPATRDAAVASLARMLDEAGA